MSIPIIPLESVLRTTSTRFKSYWDHLPEGVNKELSVMNYAKQKLLNGPTELRDDNKTGSLACLAMRFALEFNIDNISRDVSFAQVERHMRLCIATTAGLEKLITIPGSEPLLAEAAYELMKATQTNAVRHLAEHSDLNCIDRGRRGELVAALGLLIMQACDAARSITGQRWVSVAGFMEALLPESKYSELQSWALIVHKSNIAVCCHRLALQLPITTSSTHTRRGSTTNHLLTIYLLLNSLYPPARALNSALPTSPRLTTFLLSQTGQKVRATRRINARQRLRPGQIPPKQANRSPGKECGPERGALAHLRPHDFEPAHVGEHLHREVSVRHAAVYLEMRELSLGV